MSLDRGYGHVEAQEALAEMGVYSNAVMPLNRIGIPRNYLTSLSKKLSSCPPVKNAAGKCVVCTHGPKIKTCRKFNFTALHKQSSYNNKEGSAGATWELACWQDGQLIVSLSNFFSTSRCDMLTRGSASAPESYAVWGSRVHMALHNLQGRNATDGCDQLRKKMALSERRIVRAGLKGITFVFDLALTNAAIIWQYVHRGAVKRADLDRKFNKVRKSHMPSQ